MLLDFTDIVLIGCVFVFTATVIVVDHSTGRIPNKLTYPFFGLGLLFQIVFHPYAATAVGSLLNALAAFALCIGVIIVLRLLSASGGGGFKMMAALSAWLGWSMTIPTLALAALTLVTISIGASAANHLLGGRSPAKSPETLASIDPGKGPDSPPRVIPRQAPAIAVAAWIVLAWFRLWPQLV